jgi:hypothetical protein
LFEGRAHTSNGQDWLLEQEAGYAGVDGYVDTPKAVTAGKIVSAPGTAPIAFAAAIGRLIAPESEEMLAGYEAMFAKEFSVT